MKVGGKNYIVGQDRNEPKAVAHLYDGTFTDPGLPMCARGWNRSAGFGYSIFRDNWTGSICKVCLRRAEKKAPGVQSRPRKTKWL